MTLFIKGITGLKMSSPAADELFQNIPNLSFREDESFTATLRALLWERLTEEDKLAVTLQSPLYSTGDLKNTSGWDYVSNCFGRALSNKNILAIATFRAGDGDAQEYFSKMTDGLNSCRQRKYGNFKRLPDLCKFFEQHGMKVLVYIDPELHSTLILADMNMKVWHLLQAFIPKYMPWFFEKSLITEDEMLLLKTLTGRYAPAYEELIEKYADRFDFRGAAIRKQLYGFEGRKYRTALRMEQDTLENINSQIESYLRECAKLYKQLDQCNVKIAGLSSKILENKDGEATDLMEFFLCSKVLDLNGVTGSTLRFTVKTYLNNFGPEIFDRAIAQKGRSYFYRHYETGKRYRDDVTDDQIEMLMRAIFGTEQLKLCVCAAYDLNFETGGANGKRNYEFPKEVLAEYTPNQHIYHYACLGQNGEKIMRAMKNNDPISAISACIASASNFNMGESNTGTFFMQFIFAKDAGKIIELPDKTKVTPMEAIAWLEEHNGAEEEQTGEAEVVFKREEEHE